MKLKASIVILLFSMMTGLMIAANVNESREIKKVFLTPSEYQEAYNYRQKLSKEISKLEKEYYNSLNKLNKYNENKNNKENIINEIEKEIDANKLILGKLDVAGEGVEIELRDASTEYTGEIISSEERYLRIIHDRDIRGVINDLKLAGAEVISLNGQRIINLTDIFCGGVFIDVNDIKTPAPFSIKVIGNKDRIYSYMISDGKYLQFLKLREINVNIRKSDDVFIPSYDGELKVEYMKETE